MKLDKFSFLLAFLFIILSYSSSFADSQTSYFGYVNVVDVVMLHPTMKYFDISSKRFDLKAFKGIDIEERIEENKVKVRMEINKLKEELKQLDDKKKELEEIFLERSEHLLKPNETLNTLSPERREKYEEDLSRMQAKYYSDVHEITRNAYPIEKKIEKLEKSSAYSGYSTVNETRQLFSLMLDDVYSAIKEVKKRYNVSFVFNSSSSIIFPQVEMENSFNTSNTITLYDFFDKYDEVIKKNGEGEDSKVLLGNAFTQWLADRDSVLANCIDNRLSAFVIDGGKNLTYEVIDHIYEKYKVGNKQREFIKEYFNKIMVPGTEGHRDF